MKKITLSAIAVALQLCLISAPRADMLGLEQIKSALLSATAQAHSVPTDTRIETGFSPNGQALPLVLKTINSAQSTLDVMAYSFTSAEVTRALLNASKRGVKVRIVVDHKQGSPRFQCNK